MERRKINGVREDTFLEFKEAYELTKYISAPDEFKVRQRHCLEKMGKLILEICSDDDGNEAA